jgi:hypothetical protein
VTIGQKSVRHICLRMPVLEIRYGIITKDYI